MSSVWKLVQTAKRGSGGRQLKWIYINFLAMDENIEYTPAVSII